jgi:hypothetical protein
MTPYQEAMRLIRRNPESDDALGLAKLVLSLWNADYPFAFRECITGLDDLPTAIAVRVVGQFARLGEDLELQEIGTELCEMYPRMGDAASACGQARADLERKWHEEDAGNAAHGEEG